MKDDVSPNVLIIEDEYFIADELSRALSEDGVTVIGPVATPDQAYVAASEH